MLSGHDELVVVTAEVRAHLHVAALGSGETAVEVDALQARLAPHADHVAQVDVGRRADHRRGVAEGVAIRPLPTRTVIGTTRSSRGSMANVVGVKPMR